MNIQGNVIANLNLEDVMQYLIKSDPWLKKRTRPEGATPQEARYALIDRYNVLTNSNIPMVKSGRVGQRGNYNVIDRDSVANALINSSEVFSTLTANTPLQTQALNVQPTANSINKASNQINQTSPNVQQAEQRKNVRAQLKGEKITSLESRMEELTLDNSSSHENDESTLFSPELLEELEFLQNESIDNQLIERLKKLLTLFHQSSIHMPTFLAPYQEGNPDVVLAEWTKPKFAILTLRRNGGDSLEKTNYETCELTNESTRFEEGRILEALEEYFK